MNNLFSWTGNVRFLLASLAFLLVSCGGAQTIRQDSVAANERLAIAEAMFQERCKIAGEKIYRTAENVEGVFLMKLRPFGINYGNQFAMTDPYGRDLGGDGYIESFVRGEFQATHSGTPRAGAPSRIGYPYVEVIDSTDGKRYRFTGSVKAIGKKDISAQNIQAELKRNPNFDLNNYAFVLDKALATGPLLRYGVTYDDISTREEREYWIAGSSLKVIDLVTNEVMAERIGYMMDRGQGNTSGGRSPWLMAADHACPEFSSRNGSGAQTYQTLDFVEKVLKHN